MARCRSFVPFRQVGRRFANRSLSSLLRPASPLRQRRGPRMGYPVGRVSRRVPGSRVCPVKGISRRARASRGVRKCARKALLRVAATALSSRVLR